MSTQIKPEETQSEFFPNLAPKAKHQDRFPGLAKPPKTVLISATTEQIFFAVTASVLALCLVFFLGVLRGKTLKRDIFLKGPAILEPAAPKARPAAGVLVRNPAQKAIPASAVKSIPPAAIAQSTVQSAPLNEIGAAPISKRFIFFDKKAQGKNYTIQLVTHKGKDQAENEVKIVRKMGYPSFIVTSGGYYIICAGQYGSAAEAKKDLSSLRSRYRDCYLRRR